MKVKNLIKVLSAGALSAMLLTACSSESDVTTKEKSSETTKQEQPKQEAKKEESKVGTRSNPVKFNEIASIDTTTYDDQSNDYKTKIELSVEEVIRGDQAYQKLKTMNEFNEAAPAGYEWVLAKAKVKVVDSETEDHPFNIDGIMYFKFVSKSGDIYSGDIVATTEPDFSFEMYKGNEKEGYIAGLVKAGEDAELKYDPMVSDEVFFNLK
jgi:PBP1b-binding outer membrane lipoprotein LpoB